MPVWNNLWHGSGSSGGGGGGGTWGSITGTLSAQTDLQNALNAKQNLATPTTAGDIATLNALGQAVDSGVAITTSPTSNTDVQVLTSAATTTLVSNALIDGGTL
jgi:hypothetical protein